MALVYDHAPSGLLVAREAAGEPSVRAALKQLDSRLMLDYMIDPTWQRQVWQVLCHVATDQPPMVVCRWRDDATGEPLPLSHGLVDRVRNLHVESRAPKPDPDIENDRHRERLTADADAEIDFYAEELVDRLQGKKAYLLPRGAHRRNRQFPNVTGIR